MQASSPSEILSIEGLPDARFSSGTPITLEALVSKARCTVPSMTLVNALMPHICPDLAPNDTIVRLIESEPAAVALVMRAANALGPRTSDLKTALAISGARVYDALRASHALTHPPIQAPYEERIRYWQIALATCARTIASYLNDTDRDAAYCAGILSGMGRYTFVTSVPVQYAEIIEQASLWDRPVHEVETAWVEFDHHDLVDHISADFQLPESLRAALNVRDEVSAIRASSSSNLLPSVVFFARELEAHLRRLAQGTYAKGSKKRLAKLGVSMLDIPLAILDGIIEEARWACFECGEILSTEMA